MIDVSDDELHPACPRCASDDVMTVSYGLPAGSATTDEATGGCVVAPGSLRWECRSCGGRWGEFRWGPAHLAEMGNLR